ncbi:hypothetical protein FPK15_contig00037-0027 [Flavobacterium psychrophilum]|nr:hypothetical protein FPK15_contig00037-0027 [Flavobacterium psychrophilum]GAW89969.1 hypothetical protein FPS14_contig00036-0001 [Flavobacterium psychrophilum]
MVDPVPSSVTVGLAQVIITVLLTTVAVGGVQTGAGFA